MILHKKTSREPAIILQLRNEAGKTVKARITIDILQGQLIKTRRLGKTEFKLSYKDYEATISIQEAEELVSQLIEAKIRCQIVIPKILGSVLCFELDQNTLIYNEEILGRGLETKKLRTFLMSDTKRNCIMVGHTGVGKSSIVKEFVRYLMFEEQDERLKAMVVLKVKLSEIPDGKIARACFYKKLRDFIDENKDIVCLHFDSFEDLDNYPEMWDIFYECVAYWNIRVIGEISANSMLNNYFKHDIYRYINLLPVEQFELEIITKLIMSQVKMLEKFCGISIPETIVRFAVMTGGFMAVSSIVNPQLTLDILEFAAINAKISGQSTVEKANILAYYNINHTLLENTGEKDRTIIAYHEIGHYIVALRSEMINWCKNAYVSALPIAGSLGTTASYDILGKNLMRDRKFYVEEIAMCYGGRASERIFTKTLSTGASADIEEASAIAERVILSGGLANDKDVSNKSYIWEGTIKTYLLTETEKETLNTEMAALRSEGYQRADEICRKNQDLIRFLVFNLLKDGILLGTELDELVTKFEADPEGCKALIPE